MKQTSIYIELESSENAEQQNGEVLHIRRFYVNDQSPPVIMVHGSIENGKIFYSSSGKGLAPYLAQHGFDVFVVDLRGRGLSRPPINKNSKYGLSEIIQEDFPAYINKVKEIKGDVPQHWIAHSWGGILMLAHFAKYPPSVRVASMIFFGTRRRLTVKSLKRIWKIDLLWNLMARLAIHWRGYIPAKEFKAGSDNETRKSFMESNDWLKKKQWLDWKDQFDYGKALRKLKLPPTLHLVGENDKLLGHPTDVKLLMQEVGNQHQELMILGKSTGNKNDYGHNDILTHKDAPIDVYTIALNFMKNNG